MPLLTQLIMFSLPATADPKTCLFFLHTACLNLQQWHVGFFLFFFVEEDTYTNDILWLITILNHLQTGAPISLIITNADCHLGGFQPLKTVAFTPTPLVDVLGKS